MSNAIRKYAPIVGEVEAIQAPGSGTGKAFGEFVAALLTSDKVRQVAIRPDNAGVMVSFTEAISSRAVAVMWNEWLAFVGAKAKVLDAEAFEGAYRTELATGGHVSPPVD